jgi:hypothetical protein
MAIPPPMASRTLFQTAVLLTTVTIFFYWKLVFTDQYTWFESPDLAYQVLPWFQYQAGEFQAGRFPLWSPFEWAGQPLAGQTQPGTFYPLNWLLFLAPLKRGWLRADILHAYYVVIHLIGLATAYALCRDRGASRLASLAGGMVFGFGLYLGGSTWPQMINGAVWGPLIFKYHLRWREGRQPLRSTALAGGLLGLAWLSGHHQVPIFLSVALGISLLDKIRRDRGRAIPLAALCFALAFLVGAAQIVPAYEYGKLAVRWIGLDDPAPWKLKVPYILHQQWGFFPSSIVGLVIPGFNYYINVFCGVTAAVLLALGWRRQPYFTWLGAVALLYSLAEYTPIEGLLYSLLPLVEKARSPGMASSVFAIAAAVLVANGLDRLSQLPPLDRLRRGLVWFGGGLLMVIVVLAMAKGGAETIPDQRPVMTAFFALGLAAILASVTPHRRWILTAMVFAELSLVSTYFLASRYDKGRTLQTPPLAQHQEIVDFLRQEADTPRVVTAGMEHNFGDWYGVDVFGGYLASITENLYRVDFTSPRARELFAVRYWIGQAPGEQTGPAVFKGAKGWNVYPLIDPAPRARVVHALFPARDLAEAAELVANPNLNLRSAAVVADPNLTVERCASGRAEVLRRDASRIVVAAEAGCRGLLVLSEISYPGWRVRVDGRDANLVTANVAQQGVLLDKGWHTVEFLYQPHSVYLGAALTILGTLLALSASIIGRERI